MTNRDDPPVRVSRLDCWHANEIIYQADGETDDGRYIHVRYRRPYFSVGVGVTRDEAVGDATFITDAHPDHDPSTITRAILQEWCGDRFIWPDRIDGFDNEPDARG